MSIIYRQEKGAPLTAREMDDNFHELEDRIRKLEASHPHQQIDSIEMEEDHMAIKDAVGQVMHRIKLPCLGLKPRGNWQRQRAYAVNDLVNRPEGTYICMQSHQPEEFAPEHWQPLIPLTK